MSIVQPQSLIEQGGGGEWVAVARILRPRGRRGEVVAESLTDFPARFQTLKRTFLDTPAGHPQQIDVAEAWWHGERLILRFESIESIEQARALQGRLLLVPREERVPLADGQYYVSDLIGCEVVRRGRRLGKVIGIESSGGADLLRVQSSETEASSSEILIPFAREICTGIDVGGRRIVVEPPEGLLELNDEGLGKRET